MAIKDPVNDASSCRMPPPLLLSLLPLKLLEIFHCLLVIVCSTVVVVVVDVVSTLIVVDEVVLVFVINLYIDCFVVIVDVARTSKAGEPKAPMQEDGS